MYNKDDIWETVYIVKDFNRRTAKKKDHKQKIAEVKKLLEIASKIHCILFNPDSFYSFKRYKENVELFYQKNTKEDLDHYLNYCVSSILTELNDIMNIAINYEWDKERQIYVAKEAL